MLHLFKTLPPAADCILHQLPSFLHTKMQFFSMLGIFLHSFLHFSSSVLHLVHFYPKDTRNRSGFAQIFVEF